MQIIIDLFLSSQPFRGCWKKIVHDKLIECLITNKVLTPNQSAFRKLYSTVTSLINGTDYWYDNMDKKQLNLSIFLDLKKAFDTVDHRILIKKLGAYGIRGISGEWLTSFLTSRKQFFSVNGQKSEGRFVTCGIPQGSCLGPLLFIIYLNDFEKCLDFSRASMYADDTHVTLTSSNTDDLLTNAQKYKIISRQCPKSLWDKYHHRTPHSNCTTRNCRDLQIPRNNRDYVKKGFHCSTLEAWNDIPINVRELPTLKGTLSGR